MPPRKDKDRPKAQTWAMKCRTCKRYSSYDEYYQKPKMHSGKVKTQTASAQCPKCGAENQYRSDDLELVALGLLDSISKEK
jgi:Zn finger protein HypA/HybF involved in hydrogenase expression